MIRHYVLRGHEPVRASLLEWAEFFENVDSRRVAEDYVGDWHLKPCLVSTVFVGIDHDLCGDGPPILFETLVLGGPLHGENDGYSTWEEAEAGHKRMLELVITHLEERDHG